MIDRILQAVAATVRVDYLMGEKQTVCMFGPFGDANFEWFTVAEFLAFVNIVQFADVNSKAKASFI